jgi:putative lipoic acid-binding regulatory protein
MGEDGPFQFPCIFPVKVFGHNERAFRDRAWVIVHNRYPDLSADQVSENVSRNGKFLSMTFTVQAQDRESLDELYQALSDDPQILMAL